MEAVGFYGLPTAVVANRHRRKNKKGSWGEADSNGLLMGKRGLRTHRST